MKTKKSLQLTPNQPPPISPNLIIRIMAVLVVILSIVAGYYHSAWQLEEKKYDRLEDSYVRVRDILGREETQRLIDLSRELEETGNQVYP